jgi:proton glutamate symport protein
MATNPPPEAVVTPVRPHRLRLGLAEQILIGLVLGIVVGVVFGELTDSLRIVGDIFIMAMQVTVIPYIVVSLITALARLTLDEAKRLALKAGAVVFALWGIGVVVLLLTPLAFPDWPAASFFSTSLVQESEPIDFLEIYIPANPFASLATGVIPAIVVFSVAIGIGLIAVPNKKALLDPLSAVAEALFAVTGFAARLAPYGTFALAASAAGTLYLEELDRLQVYLIVQLVLAVVLTFWVLPALVATVTPLRYTETMRALRSPLLTAFAIGSVLIVLPLLAEACRNLVGEGQRPGTQRESTAAPASVDALIPVVFNIPSVGSMLTLVFVLFAGWYIGTPVPWSEYPLLIGAGFASLFAGPILATPFLLDLLRLPHDLFHLFMAVDVAGRRLGALVGVMTIATTAIVGAHALQGGVRLRALPLLRFAGVTVVLTACALIGIRAFYTHVVVAPYTKDEALRSLHLLADPQPSTVFVTMPAGLEAAATGPSDIEEIRRRGVLRACYLRDDFPSSFVNAEGRLVGFDIELVHRIARTLDLSVEFLPVRGEGKQDASRLLAAGVCDLYASTMAISPRRLEAFTMTAPIYTSSVGLIVPDHARHAFRDWDGIRERGQSVRLAVPDNPEAIDFAQWLLPDAALVPITSLEDQRRMLETGAPGVDALGALSEEGAAWALLYPQFSLAVPRPVVFTPQAIGVARGNESLVRVLDAWIAAETASGTIDRLYRYWLLGEAAKSARPPRWSVLRNVLGWAPSSGAWQES